MAAGSLDTAVGVFGIIHRLRACKCTATSGLGNREGLRAHRGGQCNGRLRCLCETILHGRGLSLVRRRADLNDMTMGRRRRGGQLWIGWDARESVSGACGDWRKNGRRSFDPWRWSARIERMIFCGGREVSVWSRGRHLALDLVELLVVVVRVEGAGWPATSDFSVAGLLLEGIWRRRIVSRRVWQGGRGPSTRAKGSVGRRR